MNKAVIVLEYLGKNKSDTDFISWCFDRISIIHSNKKYPKIPDNLYYDIEIISNNINLWNVIISSIDTNKFIDSFIFDTRVTKITDSLYTKIIYQNRKKVISDICN